MTIRQEAISVLHMEEHVVFRNSMAGLESREVRVSPATKTVPKAGANGRGLLLLQHGCHMSGDNSSVALESQTFQL